MGSIPREERLLRRSRSDRIVGGVCGGLAHYLDVDPLLVRVVFLAIAILAGSGLLLYLLLWVLIPLETHEDADVGADARAGHRPSSA